MLVNIKPKLLENPSSNYMMDILASSCNIAITKTEFKLHIEFKFRYFHHIAKPDICGQLSILNIYTFCATWRRSSLDSAAFSIIPKYIRDIIDNNNESGYHKMENSRHWYISAYNSIFWVRFNESYAMISSFPIAVKGLKHIST